MNETPYAFGTFTSMPGATASCTIRFTEPPGGPHPGLMGGSHGFNRHASPSAMRVSNPIAFHITQIIPFLQTNRPVSVKYATKQDEYLSKKLHLNTSLANIPGLAE